MGVELHEQKVRGLIAVKNLEDTKLWLLYWRKSILSHRLCQCGLSVDHRVFCLVLERVCRSEPLTEDRVTLWDDVRSRVGPKQADAQSSRRSESGWLVVTSWWFPSVGAGTGSWASAGIMLFCCWTSWASLCCCRRSLGLMILTLEGISLRSAWDHALSYNLNEDRFRVLRLRLHDNLH